MDAGLIPDPAIGDGELHVQWVSWTDWAYECEFAVDSSVLGHQEIDLVFECLDTVATVELNGVEVGRAASEFIPHRFSVAGVLRTGTNRLSVRFTSPLRHVHAEAARLGTRPVNGDWDPYVFIRKCASGFQWDWGPRAATCGITGGVRLEGWSGARIERVVPVVRHNGGSAWSVDLSVCVELSGLGEGERRWVYACMPELGAESSVEVVRSGAATQVWASLRCEVSDPGLWWPRGAGPQRVYRLVVQLRVEAMDGPGAIVVAEQNCRVGFRSIRLDDAGGRFSLVVNGRPVQCKGANWIPEGLWARDRTWERVSRRLGQLVDANMNMVRVWGGGRYEPGWFYDLCDEMGIMVWQDFMFACACYPEEEPIWSLVEAEARHQVGRLARHPAVVMWCGGNETNWAFESWGFREKLRPGQTWGKAYWEDVLPRVVREVNSTVPYWVNSPWSGSGGVHPNDAGRGDHHTWEVARPADYRGYTPPFVAEFGWQGPSDGATLAEAGVSAKGGEIVPAELVRRQRGPGGMERWLFGPMRGMFAEAGSFGKWLSQAQELQARYVAAYIEWLRVQPDRCSGILVWQFNDAWPGLSWSLIDSAGREKPVYFAVQRAFAPRLLTSQPLEGSWGVYAINETGERWKGTAVVRRLGARGGELAVARVEIDALPGTVKRVAAVTTLVGEPSEEERITVDLE